MSGKAVSSWSLTRDNTGRITRRSEAVGGNFATYDYIYDANGRLLKVLKDNVPVEEYAYDENGARIFEMNTLRGIASRSYEYYDEDHLVKAGEWIYQYNADGFLTSKTNSTNPTDRTVYSYSSRGELLTVILPDGKRIYYVCDPLGRRIAKKVNGVVVEKYLWQGMTRLLAVYDGNNTLLMRFEYTDERMPVAMRMGGATYYLTYDQVGSLRAVADFSGNVVKQVVYDSFGNVLSDTNPGFTVPFGVAGGLRDRDTGLVRFGYRDYDPEIGRWTAKDPIGFEGGNTDLYGYVLNNPVNYIDPYGLVDWGKVVGGGIAAVGGAVGVVAGAVVAGIGVVEAGSVAAGNVYGPVLATHTIGAGGMLIGAGITSGWFGLKIMYQGLFEEADWLDGAMKIDQSPAQINPCFG